MTTNAATKATKATNATNAARISYTRRSAITASAAIAGTAGTALLSSPALGATVAGDIRAQAPLPLVRPMSAQRVQENWGVCDHPNFGGGYTNRSAVLNRIAGMRVGYIRGMFTSDSMGDATIAQLRANGMGWVMTVFPTEHGMTTAALVAKIRYIGNHAADLCRAIEGPNEWNNSRAGGVPMTAAETVAVQKTIYQTVRADPRLNHVVVLGPAAHAVVLAARNGADYLDLVAAGIKPYQDAQAVHSYTAASSIDTKLPKRLQYVYAAFGAGYAVQVTETGWMTDGTRNTPQCSEAAAAQFAPQGVLIMAGLNIPTMRYETLDDCALGGDGGYGLWAMTSYTDTTKWRAKPEVASVGILLRALLDPGPAYVPAPVQLKIVGAVERAVTGKRDGTATAWLWVTGTSPVTAQVTDAQGTRSFQVTKDLTRVPLRRA